MASPFGAFVPSKSGYAELLTADLADRACRPRAERVLAAAQSTAPVATGEYRSSLKIVADLHPSRRALHITSDAPHAMAVEAKTGNLARALDAGR